MPKLPSFSELTDVRGMLDKFKGVVESFAGPSGSETTEAALEKESDPVKVKLLEIELLINQLSDIQLIQARTIHTLKNKYAEMSKAVKEKIEVEAKAETTLKSEPNEAKEETAPTPESEKAGEEAAEKSSDDKPSDT